MTWQWNTWLCHNVVGYAIGRAIYDAARMRIP